MKLALESCNVLICNSIGVVVKNHHPKSISTSPKKSAAQKFRAVGPFSVPIRKQQALDLAAPSPALHLD
jgi:hypothetical protein